MNTLREKTKKISQVLSIKKNAPFAVKLIFGLGINVVFEEWKLTIFICILVLSAHPFHLIDSNVVCVASRKLAFLDKIRGSYTTLLVIFFASPPCSISCAGGL